jgi:hypothetical protein
MNTAYTMNRPLFFIRDKAYPPTHLKNLFHESHEMFHIRMQKLGNTSAITTEEESVVLRLMLEALIEAKKKLQTF